MLTICLLRKKSENHSPISFYYIPVYHNKSQKSSAYLKKAREINLFLSFV